MLGTRAWKIQPWHKETPNPMHVSRHTAWTTWEPQEKWPHRLCLVLIIAPCYRHQKLNSKQGSSQNLWSQEQSTSPRVCRGSKAPSTIQGFCWKSRNMQSIRSIHRADVGSGLWSINRPCFLPKKMWLPICNRCRRHAETGVVVIHFPLKYEWLSLFFCVTLWPYISYWLVAANDGMTAGFAMMEPLTCSRAHWWARGSGIHEEISFRSNLGCAA